MSSTGVFRRLAKIVSMVCLEEELRGREGTEGGGRGEEEREGKRGGREEKPKLTAVILGLGGET